MAGARPVTDPSKPAPKRRRTVPVRKRHIIVYTDGERYGLRQRTGRFLHGLWGFPEELQPPIGDARLAGSIVQVYSHFRLEADVWLLHNRGEAVEFFTEEETAVLALSGADHKVLKLLS